MHALAHRNVLAFHAWYETSNHLWLVLEYAAGGDMHALIRKQKKGAYIDESTVLTGSSDGLIRVELTLHPLPTSRIPLEHGLTGSVEIEVERVTPAVLLLRASGQYLGTRRRGTP